MIFIDQMKNFKIYRTKTFLPTKKEDKKKGSAILLLTPNYESSKKVMNSNLFVNNRRYESYYIEKDVSYYIDGKFTREIEESKLIDESRELDICLEAKRSELDDSEFGVPSKRKFPLDTEKHVRSAVKFFNYVDPEDEELLAENIIKALKKFNIKDINVSEKNRFYKYYQSYIKESGIPSYHKLYSQLDIIYNMWINKTLSDNAAREKIYTIMKNNLVDITMDKIPNPEEYFSSKGNLISMSSDNMVKVLPESALNLGDKVMFFNESTVNDAQLKRLLYRSRIRYRKDLINMLDKVKEDNKWIRYTYPEIHKYLKKNLFVDLSFYNSVFFENNSWTLKKGLNLYTDFMSRLINHPTINNTGYKNKTIFIPVVDWDKLHNASVWNFRVSINPISCMYQMMFNGMSNQLKSTFGNIDIVFVGNNNYFKINFSQIDDKDFKKLSIKLKLFCIKICNNEDFEAEDIDTSADNKDSKEVIQAKIADKIELSKGIDISSQINKYNTKIDNNDILSNKKKDEVTSKNTSNKPKEIDSAYLTYNANITPQDSNTKKEIQKQKELKAKMYANTKSKLDDDEPDYNDSESENDENIEKLANAIAQATNDAESEDDALYQLDNDEIKRLLVSLGTDNEVNISASRSSRMSNLDKELLDKKVNGRTIKDILDEDNKPKQETTTINVSSPNKEEWSDLSYMNFDKNYDIDKDIVSIFRFFSTCSRPLVIKDINVTDNSTSEDRVELYDVTLEDYRGKRFRIKLDIPIMEDNRFLLRGNTKSIQTQFFNMPIIKTDLYTCQLISNYKKIFLYKTNGISLPGINKLLKAISKYNGRKIKFIPGNNKKVCAKYHLPIDYIDIANALSKIETEDYIFYFNQDEIRSTYTIEDNKGGFPFIFNKKMNTIEYFMNDYPDSLANFVCSKLFEIDPNFEEIFNSVARSSVCAYSRASIMSSKIPVVLICAYHVGLRNTMDRAKIKYKIVEKLDKEDKLDINKDWVEFMDGYVVYDVNYESSLLMNGLKVCSTEMYSLEEIDNKNMYIEFLDNYGGRIKADGLDNFRDLFVDPMIKESLEYYNLPTDYIDILLYGSSLLSDNKYIKHTDTSSRRIRRYQLIAVYTYQVLSTAYGSYSNQLKHLRQSAEFSVKQSAVIDAFLTDTITSDDSCINALRDVETTNAITTKGPSGMNADRAYSLDKRAYDESMVNVLGMSTGFAGNVGITRQATINSNINEDGYVKQNNGNIETMNDANTLTATEALIPFGSTRDDPMRTAMSFIQTSKHMVRTEDSDPLLVTSGADEVMPYITTDKFAYKAKNNGTILSIDENGILIEYSDKSKDYINLKETIEKNSDGGYYVPLKLDPIDGLKVGTKIQKNQIIAYDKYSFSNKLGESNNLAYNIGKIAKVAIINSDEGFEDSGIISASMAKKLATRIDLKYDTVVNKDCKVFKIAKVGDHIEASDDLLIWEEAFDDADADEIMASITNGDVSDLGKRKLKSEVTGVLKDIKIYRTVEIDELSPSLQKIVTEYEAPLKKTAKLLRDNELSISKVPAHYVLAPTGKLKKAQDAIIIEFYVEYLDTVGVGDKIVYNSANKAVEKDIFPEGKEPYTDFRPNEKIDAFVSVTSISKRLVSSTLVYGGLQKLMIELDRSVKDIMGIPYDDSTV